ncbi:hypothetical protein FB451DRAFT_1406577 [Mycena latifolia]|nr:hypothetical protein FB451DRAFT_1406577 [Mycena latifolia]
MRNVTIYMPRHGDLLPRTPFIWDHLAHLRLEYEDHNPSLITGLSAEEAYLLLRGCTRLVFLQFHLDYESTHPLSKPPLTLPFLQSLTFLGHRFVLPRLLANLLEHLAMPNLRHFQMPPSDTGHPGLMTHNLQLDPSTFTKHSLAETLRAFTALTNLRSIRSWTSPDPVVANTIYLLEILSPAPGLAICPELTELRIQESLHLEARLWMGFLQKHLGCGTHLRRFNLEFRLVAPKDLPEIQPFLGRGLDVSITYTGGG